VTLTRSASGVADQRFLEGVEAIGIALERRLGNAVAVERI